MYVRKNLGILQEKTKMAKEEDAKSVKEIRNEEITNTFWHSVDVRLKDLGQSRAWLGKKAGLSQQSITSAIYLKSKVNIFTALRVAEALGCTIEDLLYGGSDCRDEERSSKCVNILEDAKKELDTSSVSATSALFQRLSLDEQDAVLIHMFSLLGMKPADIISRMYSKEGEKE